MTAGSEGVPKAGAPLAGRREPPRDAAARPTADPHDVGFADHLRALCAELAATLAEPGGPALACAAAEALLPIDAAARLGLVADELVTNAFRHAFPGGRADGRVDVLFAADPDAWRLTVEDSGVGLARGDGGCRGAGLRIAEALLGQVGGRLEIPAVSAGTRCVAVVPRARPPGGPG